MSGLRRVLCPFLLLVLIVGSGCASTTPRQMFTPLTNIPPNNAVVYIYRQKHFYGSAVQFRVHVNGTPITALPSGRYIAYVASPGPLELLAKTEIPSVVKLDVKAGETYYVRADIVPGAFVGNVILNQVTNDLGAAQIAKCALAPEPR